MRNHRWIRPHLWILPLCWLLPGVGLAQRPQPTAPVSTSVVMRPSTPKPPPAGQLATPVARRARTAAPKTVAWLFETPRPVMLSTLRKRLGPKWIDRDSSSEYDSIIGPIGRGAQARIFEIGYNGFQVSLTVKSGNEATLARATRKLFDEVLPVLRARAIEQTTPENP